LRIGVLVSGAGTNLAALLEAQAQGRLGGATIGVVISNRPGARALERAQAAGVPALTIDHTAFGDRMAFETALAQALGVHRIDWVVLAGFMRLLTPHFLERFAGRVVNIHPSLLPAFPGAHAAKDALAHGVKLTGVTIHFVDEGTDTGPIIAQEGVAVADGDTEETLLARVHAVEHRLYPEVVRWLAEGRVRREGRRVQVRA
jgi:phosphoribosylglycinamide formyltransferase-1